MEYRLDSLFDAALGLELWLLDNKKAFPAEAVTQKCQRLGEIAKMATLKTLNAEDAYWELAGCTTSYTERRPERVEAAKTKLYISERIVAVSAAGRYHQRYRVGGNHRVSAHGGSARRENRRARGGGEDSTDDRVENFDEKVDLYITAALR